MHVKKNPEKFTLNVPSIPYGLANKAEHKPKSNMNEALCGKVQQIH